MTRAACGTVVFLRPGVLDRFSASLSRIMRPSPSPSRSSFQVEVRSSPG